MARGSWEEVHCPSCGQLVRQCVALAGCPDCGDKQAIFLPFAKPVPMIVNRESDWVSKRGVQHA
jgi:predicted  nucleic acid-binding Zn-ribbon protein